MISTMDMSVTILVCVTVLIFNAGMIRSIPLEHETQALGAVQFSADAAAEEPNEDESRPDSNTVCYGVLGCFSNQGKFADFLRRPLQPLPQHPSIIKTSFHLYTRQNQNISQDLHYLQWSTIDRSYFSGSRQSKVIVHGFFNTASIPWAKDMVAELLSAGDFNVIVVNWMMGAANLYNQAAVNTRVVGAEIWYLCTKLAELKGLKNEDVHIIGHSLGAHVAGYAGARMPGLDRITGLDPAEPYFQGTDPVVLLDPTDADFVDVIHTDANNVLTKLGMGGYGMSQPCGTVDFYPNGGREQPECKTEDALERGVNVGILEGMWHFATCNHMRALYLFTESITESDSECQFNAFPCPDYESFLNGKCGSCGRKCARMGYYADQSRHHLQTDKDNIYYLQTAGTRNYCRHNYVITLKTASGMASVHGQIYMDFDSDSESTTGFIELTNGATTIERSKSFLVITDEAISETTVFSLRWEPRQTWLGLGFLGNTGKEKLQIEALLIQDPIVQVQAFKNVVVQADGTVQDKGRVVRRREQ